MKISYRTHPIISKLNDGKLGRIGLYQQDQSLYNRDDLIKEMSDQFKKFSPYFKQNIKVITSPFHEAIEMAKPKMVADELFCLENDDFGSLFLPSGLTLLYYFTDFSLVNNKHGNRLYYAFWGDVLIAFGMQDKERLFSWVSKVLIDQNKNKLGQFNVHTKQAIINEIDSGYITQIMATLNFIKYCPLETTHLKANARLKDIACKYVNETDCNIEILDSKWFTTLVKSDAFKVRGHFRFQPKKKDGDWTKELIWINDFEKTGYTAPARKLSV